ncbi:MAG: hypothetical protein JO314_08430, partial [Acidobacteria bacterium]|nr:hypothetical protein [Acidobacteriota bacterium]
MKLAYKVCLTALLTFLLVFAVAAQSGNGLSADDTRNTAPTVGTGGPWGGPTGLFTVYDGKTLRKGEFTFSFAYSNYDRDPGDADITSIPLSFQYGVTNRLEIYVGTEAWRGIHINSPMNLSSFYLPNSSLVWNGVYGTGPAIVLAPGTTGPFSNRAVFRPQGMPNCIFPYTGCSAGNYGLLTGSATPFGFTPAGSNATLGPPQPGTGRAAMFPGVGSVVGGILPGIVLATAPIIGTNGRPFGTAPTVFTVAPSYLEDAPFDNRLWGQSAWNSLDMGVKWRFNKSTAAVGYGVTANYKWYTDNANTPGGFNMMNRGSGPGANRGDIGVTFFVDGRLASWVNVSGNVGYIYTMNPRGNFGGTSYTMLDRADQFMAAVGVDFPINKHFQPILEFRTLHYVGGHTPNALQNNPSDGLGGFRYFFKRWIGVGAWYRHFFNQQDSGAFGNNATTSSVVVSCQPNAGACVPITVTNSFAGVVPTNFRTSTDPHGFGFQFFAGMRTPRQGAVVNKPANVDSVTLSQSTITIPCPPGTVSDAGCSDNSSISVSTHATDPENDVLTYNYTVSGGRVVGSGANVTWDLSGARPGTYTFTAGVDDGCGVCGATKTQTVTVAECTGCHVQCSCPTISVAGPSGVTQPGQSMTFTATSSGDVTYNWTVSAGTISSGQGTSSITVDTSGVSAGSNVTATVSISGANMCADCPKTASETAGIQAKPQANLVDTYGKLSNDDVKARIDGYYTQLNNDPTAHGYIIIYGTPAQIKAARAQIDKAIAFRKYDPSRVTIVEGP